MLDLALTLHALVITWPPAAALLVAAEQGALLPLLAGLHGRLLPAMRQAFCAGLQPGEQPGPAAAGALARLRLLEAGCLQLCWQLLRLAFLTHDYLGCAAAAQLFQVGCCWPAARVANCSRQLAGGCSAAARWPARHPFAQPHSPPPPPRPPAQDTEHRGQVLVEQLMACGSGAPQAAPGGQRALLPALNAAFRLDAAVSEAVAGGLLSLDDAQLDYLLALLGGDRRLLAAGGGGGGGSSRAGPSGASSSGGPRAPEPGVVRSLVSQVKELLPDYGDGFVAACLHAAGYQPEAVVNALLEGALPAAVQGLDPQLAAWSPPAGGGGGRGGGAAAGPSGSQVGGGGCRGVPAAAAGQWAVLCGPRAGLHPRPGPGPSPTPCSAPAQAQLSWTTLADDAAAAEAAAAEAARAAAPAPSQAAQRRGAARGTARVLGGVTDDLRQATLALAEDLQAEYDDE
jgi:activating signal cointegrator complex subunit 2